MRRAQSWGWAASLVAGISLGCMNAMAQTAEALRLTVDPNTLSWGAENEYTTVKVNLSNTGSPVPVYSGSLYVSVAGPGTPTIWDVKLASEHNALKVPGSFLVGTPSSPWLQKPYQNADPDADPNVNGAEPVSSYNTDAIQILFDRNGSSTEVIPGNATAPFAEITLRRTDLDATGPWTLSLVNVHLGSAPSFVVKPDATLVTVNQNLSSEPATISLATGPAANTIGAFATVASQAYAVGKTVTITPPVASSGLPVALSVKTGPATISGNVVTLTGAGTVVLAANQPGNASFAAANEVTTSFVVTKGVAAVTLGALQQVYSAAPRVATATTAPPGLAVQFRYGGSTVAPVNAGTYVVEATVDSPNFTGSATGSLVVAKAPVTVAALDATRVYGTVNPRLRATPSGVPAGAPAPIFSLATSAQTVSPAGTYPITVTPGANANYVVTGVPGTLTVSKATLVVVALDRSKAEGAPVPPLVARYAGIKDWDSTDLLSGNVTLSTTATASSPVGTYGIQVSGPSSLANYTVFYQPGSLNVRTGVQVLGRRPLYNQSAWDGNNEAANAQDDLAVPTDKTALLPGGLATYANVTSYGRGLNGVIVDVFGLPADGTVTASDFELRSGNTQSPGTWAAAPAPASVSVRRGAGVGGSDRVTLTWTSNNGNSVQDAHEAVAGQWLQVTMKATSNTGLASPDTFYLGNAPGETGNSFSNLRVTLVDFNATVATLTSPNSASLTSRFDHNRDRAVTTADSFLVMGRLTTTLTALVVLDLRGSSSGGGSVRLAGLSGADDAEEEPWVLPADQRPLASMLLSADGTSVLVRAPDDGLPWRLQWAVEHGASAWSAWDPEAEVVGEWLAWQLPVEGETRLVRLTLE